GAVGLFFNWLGGSNNGAPHAPKGWTPPHIAPGTPSTPLQVDQSSSGNPNGTLSRGFNPAAYGDLHTDARTLVYERGGQPDQTPQDGGRSLLRQALNRFREKGSIGIDMGFGGGYGGGLDTFYKTRSFVMFASWNEQGSGIFRGINKFDPDMG